MNIYRFHKVNNNSHLKMSLVFLIFLFTPLAFSACPGGAPCASIDVFRYQSWPMPSFDNGGNDMLSIQQANAGDSVAMLGLIRARGTEELDIVIKSTVTVINEHFSAYCNCNLENNNVGCPASLPADQLLACTRQCLDSGEQCAGFGRDVLDAGIWYAFPRSTMYTVTGEWRKNVFERNPVNRDWLETNTVYKSAACLKALAIDPVYVASTFTQIFAMPNCPLILKGTLDGQAIPRL